ncbi:MAG: M48 family metalloprotease [Desulfobacterales bacterium]|nr:MAG: M48 family metalloprotease [Desulfobacterales bacterium]
MTILNRPQLWSFAGKSAVIGLGVMFLFVVFVSGCATTEAIIDIGVSSGLITESQGESISKSTKAVARSFEDFTPEQEYYVGRSVGAVILNKYKPYNSKKANDYINILGQILSKASDMPETFGGYHFLIQDSDEVNALAAPGGLIFVTRGMLRCCQHEDAVAAVLAHEIGHVQAKHGLQAIKKSRITSALTTIGIEGAKTFGEEELAELTETFESSISDITATLVNNGYSRNFERDADKAAVTILKRVGYDPNGLEDMLKIMSKKLKPGGLDFAKTHPSPASRIADIQKIIGKTTRVIKPKTRQARFIAALGNV